MTPQTTATHDVVSFEDLKLLGSAEGPCVTIVVQIPNPLEIDVRLKNALRDVRKQLAARGIDAKAADELLDPVQRAAAEAGTERVWANALILFRSADVFRHYYLRGRPTETIAVEDRFRIRPLLSSLAREQRFHLLALSQNHTRLFHCTPHRADEADLKKVAPQNLREWLKEAQPDHVLDNRSVGGPSTGHMKGVMFGTSADREADDERLSHFFKAIDKGVRTLLRDDPSPLVLAGVEYELALYRRINSHPHLFEKTVRGAPDGGSEQELHAHAREVVMQSFSEPLKRALADLVKRGDVGRATLDMREAIKAAHEGRVSDLLLAEDAEFRGRWDQKTHKVHAASEGGRSEDLLNAAALQTVLHGGQAFALSREDMPEHAPAAAVLRY